MRDAAQTFCSLIDTHHVPRTTHHSPLTTHLAPRTTHHSPPTTHHSPLTAHHTPPPDPKQVSLHCGAVTCLLPTRGDSASQLLFSAGADGAILARY